MSTCLAARRGCLRHELARILQMWRRHEESHRGWNSPVRLVPHVAIVGSCPGCLGMSLSLSLGIHLLLGPLCSCIPAQKKPSEGRRGTLLCRALRFEEGRKLTIYGGPGFGAWLLLLLLLLDIGICRALPDRDSSWSLSCQRRLLCCLQADNDHHILHS